MKSNSKINEMNVYYLNFQDYSNDIISLHTNLTQQEIVSANKYKFKNDRMRYALTRFFLRQILGNTLGINPMDIIISTNKFGKPELADKKYAFLKFNLSHSGDFVIYALSMYDEVGVDIEIVDSTINHLEIANNYFSINEILFLKNSKNKFEITDKFFRIWTRKEALLKAVGIGLLPELKKIDVLKEVIKLNLFSTESPGIQNNIFSVIDLSIHKNYKSAIAYFGEEKKINIDQITI